LDRKKWEKDFNKMMYWASGKQRSPSVLGPSCVCDVEFYIIKLGGSRRARAVNLWGVKALSAMKRARDHLQINR